MTTEYVPLAGRLLSGRYKVERRLGSGSMGDVYLAEHTLMKKKVAIKVLHPEFVANEEAVERFQREAQAAAHIDHHNVCVATDFGETEEGTFFLVMEYLEGRSLGSLIASDELGGADALRIARQIASGLVRAHALGIVHRDLKPENIMIVEREEDPRFVKIMDFGVAHVEIGESQKLTKAGTTYGTPAYMSPEQALGDEVDPRSDLYSLGVILYEMLTGTVPFFDKSAAVVMSAHADRPVTPPTERAPEAPISPQTERLVMGLLAKDPDDRPGSAEELEEAIRNLLDGSRGSTDEARERGESAAPDPATSGASPPRASGFGPLATGGHATVDPLTPESRAAEMTVSNGTGERENGSVVARAKLVWAGLPLITKVGAVAGIVAVLLFPVAIGLVIWRTVEIPEGEGASAEMVFDEPDSLEAERAEFAQRDDVAAAMSSLAGDGLGAADAFEALVRAEPENPHAAYYRGRALMKDDEVVAAVEAFRRAVELDERYARDSELLKRVFDEFEHGEDPGSTAVRAFVADALLVSDEGIEQLAAQAAEGDHYKTRYHARKILKETGTKEKLERWRQVTVELRATDACEPLERGVEELGEIGDPRGLPAVERIARLPKKGCGFLDRGDCYACLRGTVSEVKAELEKAKHAADEGEGAGAENAPDEAG